MTDELDRAAERVREALNSLSLMDGARFRFYMSGFTVEDKINDVFRAIAAAALAETEWRDIKDAPEYAPQDHITFGRHARDGTWDECKFYHGTALERHFSSYTHFLLHPAPPKPEVVPVEIVEVKDAG